jgi:hypothetical protein
MCSSGQKSIYDRTAQAQISSELAGGGGNAAG